MDINDNILVGSFSRSADRESILGCIARDNSLVILNTVVNYIKYVNNQINLGVTKYVPMLSKLNLMLNSLKYNSYSICNYKNNLADLKGIDITPPIPLNAFNISTLVSVACPPIVHEVIDTIAYHNGGPRQLLLGDTVYQDTALTILYNTAPPSRAYDAKVNNIDIQITLDTNSVYIPVACK